MILQNNGIQSSRDGGVYICVCVCVYKILCMSMIIYLYLYFDSMAKGELIGK